MLDCGEILGLTYGCIPHCKCEHRGFDRLFVFDVYRLLDSDRAIRRLAIRWRTTALLFLLLSLQQAAERHPIVFFLIALFVRLGAEVATPGEPLKQCQLFAAVQASHDPLIGGFLRFVNTSGEVMYGKALIEPC